jgi:hypothetical protein
VKVLRVLVVSADAGDDEQMGVLRCDSAREHEQQQHE